MTTIPDVASALVDICENLDDRLNHQLDIARWADEDGEQVELRLSNGQVFVLTITEVRKKL